MSQNQVSLRCPRTGNNGKCWVDWPPVLRCSKNGPSRSDICLCGVIAHWLIPARNLCTRKRPITNVDFPPPASVPFATAHSRQADDGDSSPGPALLFHLLPPSDNRPTRCAHGPLADAASMRERAEPAQRRARLPGAAPAVGERRGRLCGCCGSDRK